MVLISCCNHVDQSRFDFFKRHYLVKSGLACGCDDQSKSFETFLQTNDSIQLISRKNDKLRTWLN